MPVYKYKDLSCGHCGRAARMPVEAEYKQIIDTTADVINRDAGFTYFLCECPACKEITLLREQFSSVASLNTHVYGELDLLYPKDASEPIGLPASLREPYQSAMRCRDVDPNAFAVMLGRLLEKVCADRGATGKTLAEKISNLSTANQIPPQLIEMANGLRHLRNVGAHADLGELTNGEVSVLEGLCRALLEYLYAAPVYLRNAEMALKRLRGKVHKPSKP